MEWTSIEFEIDTRKISFGDPATMRLLELQARAIEAAAKRLGLKIYDRSKPGALIKTFEIYGPKKQVAQLNPPKGLKPWGTKEREEDRACRG